MLPIGASHSFSALVVCGYQWIFDFDFEIFFFLGCVLGGALA